MFEKPRTQLIVAVCTTCALIAFTVRLHHSVPVPAMAFYLSAALICVLGEVYARSRHKACRTKSPIR
jgi:hypothetical protein